MKDPVGPMYFLPEAQTVTWDDPGANAGEVWGHYLYNIAIWAPGNPPGLEERVRETIADVDPNLGFTGLDSYDRILGNDFQQQIMIATLTTLFGVLGLVLAAVGRSGEIGLRMALGANCGNVVRMVMRGAFSQIGIGFAIGIPAAIGAAGSWPTSSMAFALGIRRREISNLHVGDIQMREGRW